MKIFVFIKRLWRKKASIKDYDGFLGVTLSVDQVVKSLGKSECDLIYTVFSSLKTDFINLKFEKLCFWGVIWDKYRKGEKYKELYMRLDNTDYFTIYGPENAWKALQYKSYNGALPYNDEEFRKGLQFAGISLILHNDQYIMQKTLSSRIFEAVAASTIVICDNHPTVREYFGDNILYIDHTASAEEMFRQIDAHMTWIKTHPKEAHLKAKAAHEIFVNRFTYEMELKKIVTLYNKKRTKLAIKQREALL